MGPALQVLTGKEIPLSAIGTERYIWLRQCFRASCKSVREAQVLHRRGEFLTKCWRDHRRRSMLRKPYVNRLPVVVEVIAHRVG